MQKNLNFFTKIQNTIAILQIIMYNILIQWENFDIISKLLILIKKG